MPRRPSHTPAFPQHPWQSGSRQSTPARRLGRHARTGLLGLGLYGAAGLAAANEAPVQALEEVVVRAPKGGAYRATHSDSATRTDVPLKDVPQAVGTVTREVLEQTGITRMADTLDWVSGVSRQNNFGGAWDNYAIRGFAGDVNTGSDYLVNGFSANRGYNLPRDTVNVERIDVLKGPSSALYGKGDPGGLVNVVTRMPSFKPSREIALSAGTPDRYRLSADLTGPVSERFAYRLGVAAETAGSFRDIAHSRRYVVAPAFTWLPDDHTVVSYALEAAQQRAPLDRGVVAVGGRLGVVPRSRFFGEPGDGGITIRNLGHQLTVERDLGTGWKATAGLSYRTTSLAGLATEATSLQADGRTLWRQSRYRDYSSDDLAGRFDVQGKVETGPLTHTLVAGGDFYRFHTDQRMRRAMPSAAAPYAIDLFAPVYGQPRPVLRPTTDTRETQHGMGVFVQDHVALSSQWKLLGGVRLDRFEQWVDNRLAGTGTSQQHTATSPRLGLVYQPTATLSLYANTARAFRPNSGTDAATRPFAPEQGTGYEIGAKLESADGRFGGNVALFAIDKRSVLTADGANPGFQRAAGKARSRGVEADVSGRLSPNLKLLATYAFVDAEVTQDAVLPAGTPLSNVPRHSASLLGQVEFGAGAFGRAGIGTGLVYVGKRAGNATGNGFTLPAYTTVRLDAYVQPTPALRLSLNIENLFDRRYYASSYNELWVAPGNERQFTLTASYRF